MRDELEIHTVTIRATRAFWRVDAKSSTTLQFEVDSQTPGRGYGDVISVGGEFVLRGSLRVLGFAQRPNGSNYYHPILPSDAVGSFTAITGQPADESIGDPAISAFFEVTVFLSDDVLAELLASAKIGRYPHSITYRMRSPHATNPTGDCVLIDWPAQSVPARDLSPVLDIEFDWVGEDMGPNSEKARLDYERRKADKERRATELAELGSAIAEGIAPMRTDLVRQLRAHRAATIVLLLLLLIVVLWK